MGLIEIGTFSTSTPRHHDDSRLSTFDRLFSPVSINKRDGFGTPRRNDSGFNTPVRRQLRPLPVFRKEVSLHLQSLQHKSQLELKRVFLEDFPSRLISRRAPSFEGMTVKDVYFLLNACGESYKAQFTLGECYKLYHRIRSLQTLSSPFSKMTKHTRELTNTLDTYPVLASTPVGHQDYIWKTRRSESQQYSSFNESQDSGLGCSFSSSSSFYEPFFSPEIDILKELNKINCYDFTDRLLSYLSPKEVQTVSSVSRAWRGIVLDNAAANKRRCEFLIQRMFQKENKSIAKSKETTEDRVLFRDLTNKPSLPSKQPLVESANTTVFQKFVQAGKNLHKLDILLKCPKCNHPSKRDVGNKYCCTRQLCMHEFCRECSGPYLKEHSCNKPNYIEPLPKVVIGSKKSKRSLRRL